MRAGPGSLNLIGDRYSIIVLIFFIPYVLFQPPATVLLRKIGPRNFLSGITIAWGAVMIVSIIYVAILVYLISNRGLDLSRAGINWSVSV